MPFTSGVGAPTPSILLNALSTFLVANGWVKIRGETDMVCASPKAARYWRILIWETAITGDDFREMKGLEFRTTLGGAAIAGTWSAAAASGAPPGLFISADINDNVYRVTFDAGAPVIVRQLQIQADTYWYAPRDFAVQWSHDNVTWTTMKEWNAVPWAHNEVKLFDFDDATLSVRHVSATEPRRGGGRYEDQGAVPETSADRDLSNDLWVWEAPAYDADRRMYLFARGYARLENGTHGIEFFCGPDYDPLLPDTMAGHPGGTTSSVFHLMDANPSDYWFYMNGHRLILITKSGVDYYTSSYLGFLAAFSDPDSYPSPIYTASTSYQLDTFGIDDARFSSMCDPGAGGAAWFYRWDGVWESVQNRRASAATNMYLDRGYQYIWPYHAGVTGRGDWPFVWTGDNVDFDDHWLNNCVPTVQGDLPLFPCVLVHETFGNIGALDGVFAVPGGTLIPEQTFVIDLITYRAFPNANRRAGCNWFCVRED